MKPEGLTPLRSPDLASGADLECAQAARSHVPPPGNRTASSHP